MPEIADLLANNYYPRFRKIHDCVDTGADYALTADTPVLYPCDCALRNYKSTGDSLFAAGNIKDSIPEASLQCKFSGVINAPINTIMLISLVCPHPTLGDIPIEVMDYTVKKNNVNVPFSLKTTIYNGTDSDAHLYGFDVYIETNANATLKARSVLVIT